jgi:hypothetical protein
MGFPLFLPGARRLANLTGTALEQFGELTGRVSQLALDLAGLLRTRENADRLSDDESGDAAEARPAAARATSDGSTDAPQAAAGSEPPAAPARPTGPAPAEAEGTAPAPAPPAPPAPPRPAASAAPPVPGVPEPPVTTEEELVAESADPGAADGAGASINVEAPWPGYDGMRAQDVIDHAAAVDAAQLAVAELYERAHKNRTTVLAALERQLATARRAG